MLSTKLQPGTDPAETIAGKYFPSLHGGRMVIITDGGRPYQLHAYVSKTAGSMTEFVASSVQGLGPSMTPPLGQAPGMWANYQIAFFPAADGEVAPGLGRLSRCTTAHPLCTIVTSTKLFGASISEARMRPS